MPTDGLDIRQFGDFVEGVHGYRPFAWQTDLATAVVESWVWPDLIDLPTGSGKTALLDIAVFLLALDANRPMSERRAPRRIAFVVDRRVVVDQAAERAKALRRALEAPEQLTSPHMETVSAVAARLRSLSGGDGPPLVVAALRGGVVRDPSWALRPDVPTVLTSTVDQVGSRLLFRGYGESHGARPIHAGLIGTDTLLLLDEVHLSRPFAETLRAVGHYQGWAEVQPVSPRWQVVELSATPGKTAGMRFPAGPLNADSDPVLRRRLEALKPTRLRQVKTVVDAAKAREQLAVAVEQAVNELLGQPGVRTAAAVVNRVDTARQVVARIEATSGGPECVLLTGRMRSLDRDRLVGWLLPHLQTGRSRHDAQAPLVVVATQCIEAGADLDFDGLVTECASLDALRQRFGRLDRDGRLTEAGTPAPGLVLAASTSLAAGADDPVYGTALAATWTWLSAQEELDFGLAAFHPPPDDDLSPLLARPRAAPVLFPAHLDAWVQTREAPEPDPDVARWLHGPGDVDRDVTLVWRADLTESFLRSATEDRADGQRNLRHVIALTSACPPSSTEALAVPIAAVRAWLRQEGPAEPVADVEGVIEAQPTQAGARGPRQTRAEPGRPALRWRGDESAVVRADELRPGDTLLLPSSYGGLRVLARPDGRLRGASWDPTSAEPVADLGMEAQRAQRRRAVLRLVPPLWPDGVKLPVPDDVPEEVSDDRWVLDQLEILVVNLQGELAEHVRHVLRQRRAAVVRRLDGPSYSNDGKQVSWFVVTSRRPMPPMRGEDDAASVDLDETTSSFTSASIELDDHLVGVADYARRLATNCGLPDELVDDLELAGRLHDLGKADPRFQVWLHGGDAVTAALAPAALAKSAITAVDQRARDVARVRSGYPKGARHELLSLAMMESESGIPARSHDWDLVRHLVASHHGWCRPFPPVILDETPQEVRHSVDGLGLAASSNHGLERLDAGIADRFWLLVRRYGWWRLAWFEAILRLADHRRSAAEQGGAVHE